MLFTSDARAWYGKGCGVAQAGFLEEQDSMSFISQPLGPCLIPRHSIQGSLWIWAILGDSGDKGLMLVLGPADPKSAPGWETPRGYQLSYTPGHCTAQRRWCTDPGRRGFGGEGGDSTHPSVQAGSQASGGSFSLEAEPKAQHSGHSQTLCSEGEAPWASLSKFQGGRAGRRSQDTPTF